METGTGKTYVYLRTIFELSRRYGFQKFIIVVPSVAIREGVLKNIEITAEHFRALYNNLPFEHFVYDAKKVNRLRQFATSNTLQILVINIDAFRKNFTGTEAEQKSNVIYKESDKLSGRQPIEFVQAARPIVIIDEPQSVDSTDKAQEAIKALNPLCTLRYSATHRNPYNLVYRLDPVRAFELRLVKQIVVASAAAEGAANDAFVRVEQIDYKKGIKAKLRIHVQTAGRAEGEVGHGQERRRPVRALERAGAATRKASRSPRSTPSRAASSSASAMAGPCAWARRSAGCATTSGACRSSTPSSGTWTRNCSSAARGIKVLSLFFIDRVANYRDYDGAGQPVQGQVCRGVRGGARRAGEGRALPRADVAQGADREAPQRLLRPGQEGRAQGHTRRHAGRRRGLQPDHEGQGAAALAGRAAALHLQPLGAARGLGQPERLPDLHAQRDAQRR